MFKNLENPYLGPSYSNEEINKIISKNNLINKYQIEYYNDNELTKKGATILSEGDKVVGWFQGKMEFGLQEHWAIGQFYLILEILK